MNSQTIQTGISGGISQSRILLAMAGPGLLFLVGFAHGPKNALHNAAHDTRHAFTFPCH